MTDRQIKFENEPLELSDRYPERTRGLITVNETQEELLDTPSAIGYESVAFESGLKIVRAKRQLSETGNQAGI